MQQGTNKVAQFLNPYKTTIMIAKKYSNFSFIIVALVTMATMVTNAFLYSQSELPDPAVPTQKEELHDYPYSFDSLDSYFDHQTEAEKEQTTNHLKEGDTFQAKFLNMLFILILLVGFMILASWLLKRMMKSRITQINQASYIKVLETRQLSPKSVLYLVEIEKQKVLIGESQTGLSLMGKFPGSFNYDKTVIDPSNEATPETVRESVDERE